MAKMKIKHTGEYPTRYAAFDAPGSLVVNEHRKDRGGYEYAVFYLPQKNRHYPGITDGHYIEVYSYQERYIIVRWDQTKPTKERKQLSQSVKFKNDEYDAAIKKAAAFAGLALSKRAPAKTPRKKK